MGDRPEEPEGGGEGGDDESGADDGGDGLELNGVGEPRDGDERRGEVVRQGCCYLIEVKSDEAYCGETCQ